MGIYTDSNTVPYIITGHTTGGILLTLLLGTPREVFCLHYYWAHNGRYFAAQIDKPCFCFLLLLSLIDSHHAKKVQDERNLTEQIVTFFNFLCTLSCCVALRAKGLLLLTFCVHLFFYGRF